MPTDADRKNKNYDLRAKLPLIMRIVALSGIVVALLVAAIGFYRQSARTHFKLKGEHAQLSKEVIAEVNGYERLEMQDGVAKYLVKAAFARTFADQHQELENAYIEVYSSDATQSDKLTAGSVIYIPEADKNFTAYLKDNVAIESRDGFKIRSGHITYTRANETAETDELVSFERDTVRGSSVGAIAKLGERRVELLRDVEVEAFDSPELAKSKVSYAKVKAASATIDQATGRIDLNNNVNIVVNSGSGADARKSDISAFRAVLFFKDAEENSPKIKEIELSENVRILSGEANGRTTKIDAGYAKYDRDNDRYDLKRDAVIVMNEAGKSTLLKGQAVIYEPSNGKAVVTGNGYAEQNGQSIAGDTIVADMHKDGSLRNAVARGNARAVQNNDTRITRIAAPELNAAFDGQQLITDANAIGQTSVVMEPRDKTSASLITMSAVRGIGLGFKGGLMNAARTDGRTVIQMDVPNNGRAAANKRLAADSVKTTFQPNGQDLRRAEAAGNAQLDVDPLNPDPSNYRTQINAPKFDCEFFASGNNAKTCVAETKAKAVRTPTVATAARGVQTMTSDRMVADFDQTSNNIDRMTAAGNAKFNELDRNAVASQMVFTQSDGFVRFRGGEPTIWDDRARGKAREIDWDTKSNQSFLNGSVATTYYSRRQMGNAAPFAAGDKPVFVTAEKAQFDHNAETGVYSGNARSWQDNNYVRADVLRIDQKTGTLNADGGVQSGLYNAKLRSGGRESSSPVFVSSGSMNYQRDSRVLRYRTGVDVRQGTDRLTAAIVDVYLDEKNEVTRTVAENDVVITQPGRRATGTWAQYSAADDNAVLRGDPATVTDAENGASQGGEIAFNLRTRTVTNNGRAKQNTATRTRTVYKVSPNQ